MRKLRSRIMSSTNPRRSRRQDLPGSTSASSVTTQSGSSTGADRPEWATERWKVQVEAEARSRLKRRIRDLGSDG
jgi:hypothetical protein